MGTQASSNHDSTEIDAFAVLSGPLPRGHCTEKPVFREYPHACCPSGTMKFLLRRLIHAGARQERMSINCSTYARAQEPLWQPLLLTAAAADCNGCSPAVLPLLPAA